MSRRFAEVTDAMEQETVMPAAQGAGCACGIWEADMNNLLIRADATTEMVPVISCAALPWHRPGKNVAAVRYF